MSRLQTEQVMARASSNIYHEHFVFVGVAQSLFHRVSAIICPHGLSGGLYNHHRSKSLPSVWVLGKIFEERGIRRTPGEGRNCVSCVLGVLPASLCEPLWRVNVHFRVVVVSVSALVHMSLRWAELILFIHVPDGVCHRVGDQLTRISRVDIPIVACLAHVRHSRQVAHDFC
jgi:hypothetical protein